MSNSAYWGYVWARYKDGSNRIRVSFEPGRVYLLEQYAGAYYTLDSDTSFTTAANTWYTYRIVCDGAHIEVWRNEDGQMPVKVLESNSAQVLTTNYVGIATTAGSASDFDDVRIVSDSLSNATTFTVNNANELVTMVDPNGTTNFVFDDWGRMASKSRSSYTATYAYRYGQMLTSVDTNWPGEGDVEYEYGGTHQRRTVSSPSSSIDFKWNASNGLLAEEDSATSHLTTHVGSLATLDETPTPLGTYSFFAGDRIGSTSLVTDESKSTTYSQEHSPFGGLIKAEVSNIGQFAMLYSNQATSLQYATFRYYDPAISRWLSRDQVRLRQSPNLYEYVHNSPTNFVDPSGLLVADVLAAALFSGWDEYSRGCGILSIITSAGLSGAVAAAPGGFGFLSGGAGGGIAAWLRGDPIMENVIIGSLANGILGSVGDAVEASAPLSGPMVPVVVAGGAVIGGAGASIAISGIDSISPRGRYFGNCLID